jgi:Family of unknown function (DUF5677)
MPLDLNQHCELADEVLELVRTRLPGTTPQVGDWNDRLLVEAFARAYRCLRSVRELAGRGEADDAAVLTRALIALTLRYLWIARVDDEDERDDRLRRLLRKWATDRATLGEELIGLGYIPDDEMSAEQLRQHVATFRGRADTFRDEGVGPVLDDRATALALDRDLRPEAPRFFELIYTRIYRTTSDVAHYGIGTALAGYPRNPDQPGELCLEKIDDERAADALGLAIIAFAALLDFSEPTVQHGLTNEVAELIQSRRFDHP